MSLFALNYLLNSLIYVFIHTLIGAKKPPFLYFLTGNLALFTIGVFVILFVPEVFFTKGLDDLHYANVIIKDTTRTYEYGYWLLWLKLFIHQGIVESKLVALLAIQNNLFLLSVSFLILERNNLKVSLFTYIGSLYFITYLNREPVVFLALTLGLLHPGKKFTYLAFVLLFIVRPIMIIFFMVMLVLRVERLKKFVVIFLVNLYLFKSYFLNLVPSVYLDMYYYYMDRYSSAAMSSSGIGSVILASKYTLLKLFYIALSPFPTFILRDVSIRAIFLFILMIAFYYSLFRRKINKLSNEFIIMHLSWAFLVMNSSMDWRHMLSFTLVSTVIFYLPNEKSIVNQ